MTPGPAHTAPPDVSLPGNGKMVAVMGAVGLIASVLLVATFQMTTPFIEANRAEYLNQAIFDVLPGAETKITYTREGERLVPIAGDGANRFRVFAGYDKAGKLVGIAIEAQGQGFQDVLRLIYGYVPACACIVGLKVLESKETPGLGDKIETDAAFRSNFDSLDVRLAPDQQRLLHEIGLVKQAGAKATWDIAAITGATISSRAVATILNQRSHEILPLIHKNLGQLQERQ